MGYVNSAEEAMNVIGHIHSKLSPMMSKGRVTVKPGDRESTYHFAGMEMVFTGNLAINYSEEPVHQPGKAPFCSEISLKDANSLLSALNSGRGYFRCQDVEGCSVVMEFR